MVFHSFCGKEKVYRGLNAEGKLRIIMLLQSIHSMSFPHVRLTFCFALFT